MCVQQRIFTSGGRLCDDDSAILEAHKDNPDGGRKMFMLGAEYGRGRDLAHPALIVSVLASVAASPWRIVDRYCSYCTMLYFCVSFFLHEQYRCGIDVAPALFSRAALRCVL